MGVYLSVGHRHMLSSEECLGQFQDCDLDIIFVINETFERNKMSKQSIEERTIGCIIRFRESVERKTGL